MPNELVPEVLFSCDGCYFDVFAVSGDDVACFCDLYCVASVMVIVASTNHYAMGPQSSCRTAIVDPIKINHYFWQYHISYSFFACLLTIASYCYSLPSELIGSLFIIDIMPNIGWLKINVAGFCSLGSNGVAVICNKVIYIFISSNTFFRSPL